MLELIEQFKKNYPYLQEEDIQIVLEKCQLKSLKAGEELVRFEQWTGNVIYVLDGLFEMYCIDSKGRKRILEFIQANQITGNWQRTLAEKQSNIIIRAIEDASYVEILIEDIDRFLEENHRIARIYNDILREMYANALNENYFQMHLKPEDRYFWMLENQTALLGRITQKQLAAYLGITEVSLSRIKKRVR
jgi:CRP-like cAMP-binding protein